MNQPGLPTSAHTRSRKHFLIAVGVVLLAGLFTLSWEMYENYLEHKPVSGPKLLMLGIDAGTWDIIQPLVDAGKMPNLAKLMQEGVRATPTTLNPVISPAIWTTIATGKIPEKHGVRNFVETSNDYGIKMISSESRTTKALWNILNQHGLSVGLMSYWATWPPEKIDGYNVSDLAVIDNVLGIWPEPLQRAIVLNTLATFGVDLLKNELDLHFGEPTSINDEAFFDTSRKIIDILDRATRSNSLFAFDREQPDVLMQVNGSVDASQHLFLKFLRPNEYPEPIPQALVDKYQNIITDLYIKQDGMIGEYLERSGPETHIIVLSDHGVFIDPAYGYRFTKMNSLLADLGYLTYDATGKIDYAKTRAFECNNNNFDWQRRLCINLKGRYANGIVEQSAFNQMRAEIIRALQGLKTVEGESLMISVGRATEATADVTYDIRRDLISSTLIAGAIRRPIRDYVALSVESGNHYSNPVGPNGFLVWKGPNIKKNEIVDLDYVDITPNILAAFGLPIGRDMDGKFRPELFIKPPPPTYIDSYDGVEARLTVANRVSLEDDDEVILNDRHVQFTSSIQGDDGGFDELCLHAPTFVFRDAAVLVDGYTVNQTTGTLEGEGLFRYRKLEDIPETTMFEINLRTLSFDAGDERNYLYRTSVDVKKPSYLGVWTNLAFRAEMPSKGVLTIIAGGTKVAGKGPELAITQNGETRVIEITSEAFGRYTIPVDAGPIAFQYINDEIVGREDRNLLIQELEFTPSSAPILTDATQFFRESDDLCFINRTPGVTELNFQLLTATEASMYAEQEEKAMKLLQETGTLKGE